MTTLDDVTEFALTNFILGTTMCPVDRKRTAMALRLAKIDGTYDEVARLAMAKHKGWQTRLTLWQRKWQASESRRPQRGRHHDSWEIREGYVRCHNNNRYFEVNP